MNNGYGHCRTSCPSIPDSVWGQRRPWRPAPTFTLQNNARQKEVRNIVVKVLVVFFVIEEAATTARADFFALRSLATISHTITIHARAGQYACTVHQEYLLRSGLDINFLTHSFMILIVLTLRNTSCHSEYTGPSSRSPRAGPAGCRRHRPG